MLKGNSTGCLKGILLGFLWYVKMCNYKFALLYFVSSSVYFVIVHVTFTSCTCIYHLILNLKTL